MRLIIDGLTDQALDHPQLFTLLLRYFLFGLTAVIFSRLLRQIPLKLSHKAEYHLRKDIFAHLTRLDSSYYRTQRTGDLMTRLSSDINMVRDAIGQGLLQGIRTIIVLCSHSSSCFLQIDNLHSLSMPYTSPWSSSSSSSYASCDADKRAPRTSLRALQLLPRKLQRNTLPQRFCPRRTA